MPRARPRVDPFTLAIVVTVAFASVFPCRGPVASGAALVTDGAIALLFFFHGARLSRAAIVSGLTQGRLHALVLLSTFVVFPVLGLALRPIVRALSSEELSAGFLFLCLVPSTVQSSIAFTALAGGNVAGAVCSASASSLFGIVLTPLLVQAFGLSAASASSEKHAIVSVSLQMLLPFALGQLARPRLLAWLERRRASLQLIDRGSILLIVYTAFSAAVVKGLWRQVPPSALVALALLSSVLLALALLFTWRASRWLAFSRQDEIVAVFCGSKKSLASGVPLANVLFPAATVGALLLPLMIFHQLQLMVCAVIAQRYALTLEPNALRLETRAAKP